MATTINSRILRTFSLLVIICLLSVPTQAKYSGGTGELNDPYQIATAEDLMLLGETPNDYNKHFILTDNIDLNPNLPGRKVFNKAVIAQVTLVQDPSSLSTVGAPFVGVFDGNNHTVSHLTISGGDCVGLFGCLESGAEVRNLGVVNVNITTYGDCVGPLVGCNFGKVTQCHSTGSVSGMNFVGGLVGLNYSGRLTACYSTSTVSGDNRVGGLAGNNGTQYRYDRPAGSVTQCYSTGRVSGTAWGWGTGGLVGASDGTVAQCYSTATVSGGNVVGGLVGCNYTSVDQCYSIGAVSGSDNVGGLVGILGTAVACFWDTQTSGRATSVGGTGKTTAQMQRAATFATWDFQGTWKIQEGMGYPRLKWEPNPNPAVTTLEKVSGDNQRAMVGSRLAIPLTVCVKEQYAQGMANVQVAFIVIGGDGTIEPASAVTNAGGLASAELTLGPTAGLTQVRATVGSLSVDFSIEALSLPAATTLEKVSGDNQSAMVGSKLAAPLTVRVKDQYGQNIAGVQVAFVVTVGDGTIEPASVVTGANGLASAELTLGPTAGLTQIRASVGSLSVDFSIEATPLPAATTLEKVSGDNQSAMAGSKLAAPLAVRVKDQYGQNMAGVQVAFIFLAGDGTVEPASAVTNAGGLAAVVVTLGPTAGLTQVRASVGSLSVDFSIEATPLRAATTLEKVSGDNQRAMVGSKLAAPLAMRVKDQYGQVMAGVQVAFAFVAGNGTVEPASAVTNASGIASATVTLGPTAGPVKVRATIGSLSVEFSMEALALPVATNLEKVSGDNQQAMVGSRLPSPLSVRVKDQSRQVMAGVQVAFAFVAGNGTVEPAVAVTNASGIASATVTLGTTAGLTQVRATVGSLSVDFSIEATPLPAATTLEKVSGDNQRAVAGSKLASPLAVRVKDQYGQNIAGVQVAFVVTVGDGTIEPASVTTGANGLAAAELTLGMTVGLTQVMASVGNLSVDFSIEATSFAPATFSQILYEPIAEIVVPTGEDLVTRAVEEKDGYVYLLTRDGILYTYDVASLPLQQSFVTYRTPVSTQTVSNGTGILRYGDYVYAYGDRGMTVLDVQNPRTPAVVGTSASNRRVYNLARHDDYLIAVGRVNGDVYYMDGKAMVYSISDPANPVLVSELSLGTGESGWSVAVYGSTLYIVHFSASTSHLVLQVVDFSDPSHLSIVRTLDLQTGSAYHLRIVGSQLVECGSDHISLWDLTRPYSPVLLTEQPAEPRVCAQDGDNIVTNGMVFRPSGSELQMVAAFTPGGSQVDAFPYGSAVNTSFVFIAQSGRILVLNASVPVLTINYARGGPGSFFTITGHDFPPNRTATVVVNDYTLGTVSTDSSGGIRFLLDTEQADEGRYIVTATSGLSASTSFVIASGEPVHPQEGSGTIFGIPSGITYVKYCGGSGTVDDPYRIAMAEDLMLLGESPEDYDKHFILTADIDLHPNLPGRKVFDEAVIAPHAGTAHTGGWPFNENPFKGIFDGNGHKISHLTINSGDYLGLFGQLAAGAEVKNLGVVNVDIDNSSGERIGGLVGLSWDGIVTNCYSTGTVTGSYYVGGLVGYNVGTVTCCYSTCVVDGLKWSIGGLVGYNGAYVQQSYSTGNVIGNIETGGLVGENGGTVTECYSTGRLWGSSDVGGLVGYDYDWSQADRCFWDTQTSGRATSAGGTGKTTAQMKRASTFIDAGWDFMDETANGTEDIWWIDEGRDYPRLWWEADNN